MLELVHHHCLASRVAVGTCWCKVLTLVHHAWTPCIEGASYIAEQVHFVQLDLFVAQVADF